MLGFQTKALVVTSITTTTSKTPDEKEPATSFAVIPYIQGVTEPTKRIWITKTFMLLKYLFRL